jgi:hypothetical protein
MILCSLPTQRTIVAADVSNDRARVQLAFRLLYQRQPKPAETSRNQPKPAETSRRQPTPKAASIIRGHLHRGSPERESSPASFTVPPTNMA